MAKCSGSEKLAVCVARIMTFRGHQLQHTLPKDKSFHGRRIDKGWSVLHATSPLTAHFPQTRELDWKASLPDPCTLRKKKLRYSTRGTLRSTNLEYTDLSVRVTAEVDNTS